MGFFQPFLLDISNAGSLCCRYKFWSVDQIAADASMKFLSVNMLAQRITAKYNSIYMPFIDTWGVLMRKDSPHKKPEDEIISPNCPISRKSLVFCIFRYSISQSSTCSSLSISVRILKRRYISAFLCHTIFRFMFHNICFIINFLFQCHIFIIYKRKQILFSITNLFQVILINYDNIFTFM